MAQWIIDTISKRQYWCSNPSENELYISQKIECSITNTTFISYYTMVLTSKKILLTAKL